MPNMASWFPERYTSLRDRLVRARADAGMTQTQVAKALGVPQQLISRTEIGDRRIDPAELEALANLYGKPLAFFFEDDQEPEA